MENRAGRLSCRNSERFYCPPIRSASALFRDVRFTLRASPLSPLQILVSLLGHARARFLLLKYNNRELLRRIAQDVNWSREFSENDRTLLGENT